MCYSLRNASSALKALTAINSKRALVLDGAMGTQIQKFKLKPKHYGVGASRGNNDALNMTQPKVVEGVHAAYAAAGSDVLSTNTFCSCSVSQADYGTPYSCSDLNARGCLIARRACLKAGFAQARRVFVAGVLGPTNKSASIPTDASKPAHRDVTFDDLASGYRQQADALLASGADALLVETVFDTLNAKAGLKACIDASASYRKRRALVASATISDASSRTLSGQTIEAF